jgi:mRNA-degrading endonuclease RelE of RelBE toxin-antitoxin system
MMSVQYHPQVKKDLKHLDKHIARDILIEHIPHILNNPQKGVLLTGELRNFYKFVCTLHGTSYRIIYTIDTNPENIVNVYYIGTRENAYARLMRRL